MDTSAYNRMVLNRIATDSDEVFGNMTPANARFIVPEFIKAATESVVIFSGSMPPWFYGKVHNGEENSILTVIRDKAKMLADKFHENADGAIKVITVNGFFNPDLESFANSVAEENNGVKVVKIIQAKYSGNPETLQHYIVVDHKRYRLEVPHADCRDSEPDAVMAEVCCNGPVKALRLEKAFDEIWSRLAAKRSA